MNTYHDTEEANLDKSQLEMLLQALNASPSTMRRDTSGLWVLQGKSGYCSTWGDNATYGLTVVPFTEMSKLAWTWVKKRLAFAELTQDGDAEGVFRLHELPSPAEADEIRDIIGLRKRVELSPGERERRIQWAKNLNAQLESDGENGF